MRNIILIIDDQPERYNYFSSLLYKLHLGINIVCVSSMDAYNLVNKQNVLIIFLDYDIPYIDFDKTIQYQTGLEYAKLILKSMSNYSISPSDDPTNIAPDVPIIITSANKDGSKVLCNLFIENNINYKYNTCLDNNPEQRWLCEVLVEVCKPNSKYKKN